jgi:hypothetical protein
MGVGGQLQALTALPPERHPVPIVEEAGPHWQWLNVNKIFHSVANLFTPERIVRDQKPLRRNLKEKRGGGGKRKILKSTQKRATAFAIIAVFFVVGL